MKVLSNCLGPHGLYSPWNSPSQNSGIGSLSLLQGIFPTQRSNPGPQHRRDSLPAEPQGKPKNTGVGSLSLPQWIFLTQKLDQGLLNCRRILYQLSYQGRLFFFFFSHHQRGGGAHSKPVGVDFLSTQVETGSKTDTISF